MSRLTKTLLVLCFCPCVCHCVTNARDSQGRILTTSHMGEATQKWDTWQSLELASRSLKGWNLWTLFDNTRPFPYCDKFKKRAFKTKFESKYCVQLVYMVRIHTKEPTWLLYKRTMGLFYSFYTFSYEFFLNEIFCNLLLKIHIVAPIDHMFCVNPYWINMKISKYVNFARFCVSFWKFIIILNHNKIC
jgi:hypothetical protein